LTSTPSDSKSLSACDWRNTNQARNIAHIHDVLEVEIELDPIYVDTAIRRWRKYTGESAILGETGEAFSDVEVKRG
jgi:hypothetical protein